MRSVSHSRKAVEAPQYWANLEFGTYPVGFTGEKRSTLEEEAQEINGKGWVETPRSEWKAYSNPAVYNRRRRKRSSERKGA